MTDDPGAMLGELRGRPLIVAEREGVALRLHFGESGERVLEVSCAWRLTDGEHVLAASGDVFTPADPTADLETFDWSAPGATWCDVQLGHLTEERLADAPVVEEVEPDVLGNLRLQMAGGLLFEAFANSSAAPHVESEFWRLRPPGGGRQLVVGSAGAALVTEH